MATAGRRKAASKAGRWDADGIVVRCAHRDAFAQPREGICRPRRFDHRARCRIDGRRVRDGQSAAAAAVAGHGHLEGRGLSDSKLGCEPGRSEPWADDGGFRRAASRGVGIGRCGDLRADVPDAEASRRWPDPCRCEHGVRRLLRGAWGSPIRRPAAHGIRDRAATRSPL
jgi:hypothetical protein